MANDDDILDDTGDEWGPKNPWRDREFPPAINMLRADREEAPAWLADCRLDNVASLFNARAVFYPGSGTDIHAVELFGASHNAHCFVHADYGIGAEQILGGLERGQPHHLNGYQPTFPQIIAPDAIVRLLNLDRNHPIPGQELSLGHALWTVLRRDDGLDDIHGPERLAFLHICADAFWVFWNIWARSGRPPHAILLQDHGFGGNYANFGGPDSPMYRFANPRALPRWLLVADNTDCWPGYQPVSDPTVPTDFNSHRRRLFRSPR